SARNLHILRPVIWEHWRRRRRGEDQPLPPPPGPFEDLLEEAPIVALLLDSDFHVLAANRAGRQAFGLEKDQLPLGLLEAPREGRLPEALRRGPARGGLRLSHRRRIVQFKLSPGPRRGDTLMFMDDLTELRRLETVRQEFVANLSHELRNPLTSL